MFFFLPFLSGVVHVLLLPTSSALFSSALLSSIGPTPTPTPTPTPLPPILTLLYFTLLYLVGCSVSVSVSVCSTHFSLSLGNRGKGGEERDTPAPGQASRQASGVSYLYVHLSSPSQPESSFLCWYTTADATASLAWPGLASQSHSRNRTESVRPGASFLLLLEMERARKIRVRTNSSFDNSSRVMSECPNFPQKV